MITWGFRKFYGYQMHMARYHFENIPVFCDFDLMELLINSSFIDTYKNSFKSLFHRRNSRRLQLEIITQNSVALSAIPLDRGYSPEEALTRVKIIKKVYKYFQRKRRIKNGNYIPDFLVQRWENLILESELIYVASSKEIFDKSEVKSKFISPAYEVSLKDVNLISNLLFLNL